MHPSARLSTLFACLSVCLPVSLPVYLCVCLSFRPSLYLFVRHSVVFSRVRRVGIAGRHSSAPIFVSLDILVDSTVSLLTPS